MNLSEIKTAMTRWQNLINGYYNSNPQAAQQILDTLNQGEYFNIDRQEFQVWEQLNPSSIHCYVGIDSNSELKFFLIDSVNDASGAFENNIVVKNYSPNHDLNQLLSNLNSNLPPVVEPYEISKSEAKQRRTNWIQNDTVWLGEINPNLNPVFQAFQIPFIDFQAIFSHNVSTATNFLGLRNSGSNLFQFDIELIVGTTITSPNDLDYFVDVSRPIPPFSGGESTSDYKLLASI